MKNIITYIFENLRINKDTKIKPHNDPTHIDYESLHDVLYTLIEADYSMGDAQDTNDTSCLIGLIKKYKSILRAIDEYTKEHTKDGDFNWNYIVEEVEKYEDKKLSIEDVRDNIEKYDKRLTKKMLELSKDFDE